MSAISCHTSCNFPSHFRTSATITPSSSLLPKFTQNPNTKTTRKPPLSLSSSSSRCYLSLSPLPRSTLLKLKWKLKGRTCGALHICHNSLNNKNNGRGSTAKEEWTTSILLFVLWAALMYYVFMLTPDQTPSRDMYFLEKLLNLRGDDGFEMNKVLVSLWYIMGLWPLLYSMLLLPSGRSSSKSGVAVWPFLVLSFFGGAYVLLPYFVLWKPPAPCVEETELGRWPLNFLESKVTAGITIVAGLGIITYAGVAGADVWKEFYQYFRESKFIHITCLDFSLLSIFAPFWVYNDITARKWWDKGSWILPLTLIPFLGPAFYLLLRPPLAPHRD